jgi:tRNA threonylcarbamoyladenosine biosynthesis protein TsaB
MIDDILDEAGLAATDLGGLVGVRGPGSFTGLRVGLSTLLGLHRALDLPATAVPTFEVLAWQARTRGERLLPVVDALRGEWFSQLFQSAGAHSPPDACEEPTLRRPEELVAAEASIVGFGLDSLEDVLKGAAPLVEAEALAPALLELVAASQPVWDAAPLTEPLYLRQAATTPPKR